MKNNYSTYASLLAETPDEAKMVERWLEERNVDIELRVEAQKTMPSLPVEDRPTLAKACDQYNADIQPGQIRILSKRFTEDPDVIPYVAVLEMWDDGMWLVAPFSQYTTPATSGEMATGINIQGLNVIQAWNGRTVQSRLLEKSFLFGELDEVVREQALALFRHEFGGVDLPIGFNALRGPAIVMAGDPRRDYVAETIARLRPLSTAVKATARFFADEEIQTIRESFVRCGFGEQLSRMAAKNEMQMIETHKLGDNELELVYSPSERVVRLKVYGADDELTNACDGFALLDGAGEFLGVFANGLMQVPAESILNEFRITDLNGVPVLEAE